jgi:hypothetical protein
MSMGYNKQCTKIRAKNLYISKNQSRKKNEEFATNLADNQVPEPAKA